MKTKEIDVWVSEAMQKEGGHGFIQSTPFDCSMKAKLIITLPERKVEITEQDFNEVLAEVQDECTFLYSSRLFVSRLREKLFKEQA